MGVGDGGWGGGVGGHVHTLLQATRLLGCTLLCSPQGSGHKPLFYLKIHFKDILPVPSRKPSQLTGLLYLFSDPYGIS